MQSVTICLPYTLNSFTLRGVVQVFINRCQQGLPSEVIIDFVYLGFIEPAGVTFLSNFVHWLHHKETKCLFKNYDKYSPALRFLDDSLFFEMHMGKKVNIYSNPRQTTQHLRRVGHSQSHSFINMTLAPWLASTMQATNSSVYPFQACLSEIFNNIADHTERDNGSIFAQNFPKKREVKISIADFGCGIPHNVRTIAPSLTDNEAIIQAVELEFSTRSTPRNRGIGLDYLLQTVVGVNGGEVTICSLGGSVKFIPAQVGGAVYQVVPSAIHGFCPGTTIDMLLKADNIIFVEDRSEDLEW